MKGLERAGLRGLRRFIGARQAERIAGTYRDHFLPSLEALTYSMSSRGRDSRDRLRELADRYRGERCFVIGNGPSIADTDISRLRNEHTFGLNRGYLLFDRIGGPTTFLVAINRHVIDQFAPELISAGPPVFVGWRSHADLPDSPRFIFIRRAPRSRFGRDIVRDGASEGPTVTYMALQLAYHMGFREVVLIGVDHSFASTGPANKLIVSAGADPNHFDPNYFGAGVRWQLPDLPASEVVYRRAKAVFEADGRRIVDATVGGKLAVFEKADFTALTT